MSIALESRWPEPQQSQVDDEHVADLGENSGEGKGGRLAGHSSVLVPQG